MRDVRAWAMVEPVETMTITLRIGFAGESATAHPAGRASDPDGATRDFEGWLGLVSAIEELLSGTLAGDPREQGGDHP